jgi:hypothetical protein
VILGAPAIRLGDSGTVSKKSRELGADAIRHKKPDGGGQISVPTVNLYFAHSARQGHVIVVRNFFQLPPESIFETDASFMSFDNDGSFDDERFHVRVLWQGFATTNSCHGNENRAAQNWTLRQ